MFDIETQISGLLNIGAKEIDAESVQQLLLKYKIALLNLELERLSHKVTRDKLQAIQADLEFAYSE